MSLSTAWEVEGKPLRDPCICWATELQGCLGAKWPIVGEQEATPLGPLHAPHA